MNYNQVRELFYDTMGTFFYFVTDYGFMFASITQAARTAGRVWVGIIFLKFFQKGIDWPTHQGRKVPPPFIAKTGIPEFLKNCTSSL